MTEKLNCATCSVQQEKNQGCQHLCAFDAFQHLKNVIADATLQILTVIKSKLPDPPLQLVHSSEVCEYVGIVPKTLYRREKMGQISYSKKDHTGKYYAHSDMVAFKKRYHSLI